ncbi:MAG: Ig-like domain-containing protein [Gemmatimonadales bacterium]
MTIRGLLAVLPGVLGLVGVARAQNVAEVQVAPPSITIQVGERSGLLATAFDRIGNVIPTVRFVWSSNNVNVARVDNSGTVTGIGTGVALIEARVGSRRGQAAVQVVGGSEPAERPGAPPATPPPPPPAAPGPPAPPAPDPLADQPPGTGPAAALRIEPGVVYLLPSENTRVAPRALRADGMPAAPVAVTWKSLRTDIASIDPNGNVVALMPGQGTIQATAPGGLTTTAPVVVQSADFAIRQASPLRLSPGDTDTLQVIVPSQDGRPVNRNVLQWSSNDHAVARVTPAGVVTAVGPGRAILTVSGLLQTRTLEVLVHRVATSMAIRPSRAPEVQVPLSASLRFAAEALAADNTPIPEAPLRWSVADAAIASLAVDSGGGGATLTGRAVGKTQLTVRGPGAGLSVTWNIAVIAGAVKFAQPRVGLGLNQRHTLRGNYADEQGAVIGPATGLQWSSDNPQVATVAEDGTVTGAGYGHARITAVAPGGKTVSADVYVVGEIVVASSRAAGKFQLYAAERANLAQLHRVAAPGDTLSAAEPAFSPDGSRIAFVSTSPGNAEIYVMHADGSAPTRLTTDPQADGHPVFTPDGQTIVFQSSRTAGRSQIWAMAADGSGPTQLTRDSVNMAPAVSRDGQTIAYVSVRDRRPDIWLMSRDGANQRAFTRTRDVSETEPRFLRDGSLAYIVERRERNRTVQQVVKADLTTGATTPLTGTDFAIAWFAASASGDLLALGVNARPDDRRNPSWRVYILPVATGTPIPMPTSGAEQMQTPTFRP